MRKRAAGRSPALIGAIVLTVAAVITFLGFTKDIPFVNNPYEVKAAFRDSRGIKPNSPVRIAGVEVGRVRAVERTSDGSRAAVVTMAIKDNGRPVHKDATARIRPRIFLEGNFYIQLEPGTSRGPELGEDDMIPVERTSSSVQLDEILKELKSDVRRDLRQIFAELFRTEAAGGAREFNASLVHQGPAYKYSAIVAEALLGERPGDLARYFRGQATVAEALNRDRGELQGFITNFNRTAAALADREADLRAAIDELPRALEATQPALAALNRAFPDVRRFAVAARPGIRSVAPAARATTPFVQQLSGLVGRNELRGLTADLRRAIPALAGTAQESVPLLEQQRLLSSCAEEVLVPWGNDSVGDPNFPASGPVHQETPKSLVGLAGESRSFDANGAWFKVLLTGGLETVSLGNGLIGTSATSIRGVNPPPDRTRPPLRPDVPCETQQTPDLRSNPSRGPERMNTNPGSRAARQRAAKAREIAIDLTRRQLKASGSDLQVSDRPATAKDIEALAAKWGLRDQLERLRKKAAEGGR